MHFTKINYCHFRYTLKTLNTKKNVTYRTFALYLAGINLFHCLVIFRLARKNVEKTARNLLTFQPTVPGDIVSVESTYNNVLGLSSNTAPVCNSHYCRIHTLNAICLFCQIDDYCSQ